MENNSQATINDILAAINDYAASNDNQLDEIKSQLLNLKSDVSSMKAAMVTKDYLDQKLADLRGELILLIRREDKKITA